jgi:hypothetical protein
MAGGFGSAFLLVPLTAFFWDADSSDQHWNYYDRTWSRPCWAMDGKYTGQKNLRF